MIKVIEKNLTGLWRGSDIVDEWIVRGKSVKEIISKMLSLTSDNGIIEIFTGKTNHELKPHRRILIIDEIELYREV